MSGKRNEWDEVDGPFKIPESAFPAPPEAPEAGGVSLSEAELDEIMGAQTASQAPAADANPWISEGKPGLYVEEDDYAAPPPAPPPPPRAPTPQPAPRAATPRPVMRAVTPQPAQRSAAPPPRATPPPADMSGLVVEFSPSQEDDAPVKQRGPTPEEASANAMSYMALGIMAVLIGVVGAFGLVLAVTTLTAPEVEVAAKPERDLGNVKVRKMTEPPPNLMEQNIREFEEREAARARGELVEEPAPTDAVAPTPPPATATGDAEEAEDAEQADEAPRLTDKLR